MPRRESWCYRTAHAAAAIVTVLLPSTVVVLGTDAVLFVTEQLGLVQKRSVLKRYGLGNLNRWGG